MSTVGPVCHIPPKNVAVTPSPKDMPGLPGPVAPPSNPGNPAQQQAFNNQLAQAINQMLLLLKMLSNQNGGNGNGGRNQQPPRWSETNRAVETVRVYQNNDPTSSNWVDVEQINTLTMTDGVTGAKWTWKRE